MGQFREFREFLFLFFFNQRNNKKEFNKQITHSCQEVIKYKAIYKN